MLKENLLNIIKSDMRIIQKIKDIKWELKLAYQRFLNGYDESMVWHFDINHLLFMKLTLSQLQKTKNTHPVEITSEEWDGVLQDIIDRINELIINYDNYNMNRIERQEKTDELFSIVSRWYWDLWD